MRVEGEGQDWQFLNAPAGGQQLFHESFETSRLMVAAATGIPVHYFGDPATGNLATATAMELPQRKRFEGWQQWFVGQYDNLFRSLAALEGVKVNTAQFIEIDFPALTQDDFASKATGLAALKMAGGISDEDFAREVAYMVQTDDVEGFVERAMSGTEGPEEQLLAMAENQPLKFAGLFRKTARKLEDKVTEGWVTVNGHHVLIGEDDDTSIGGIKHLTEQKTVYWRVQPKGKDLNHYSTSSADETGSKIGLMVYREPVEPTDWTPNVDTEEWVAIRTKAGHWDVGDAEGVSIDPKKATIVRRVSVKSMNRYFDHRAGRKPGSDAPSYNAKGRKGLRWNEETHQFEEYIMESKAKSW